jgi:hypothetical protein
MILQKNIYYSSVPIQLPNEADACPVIRWEHRDLFNLGKSAWDIYIHSIPDKSNIGFPGNSLFLNTCLAAIFVKQGKMFFSTYTLCYYGLGHEAELPLRSMFETLINLEYLNKSTDKNSIGREWLLWDIANDEKIAREYKGQNPETDKAIAELEASVAKRKTIIPTEQWKEFVKNGPSKVDRATLAKNMGYSESYKTFYAMASSAAHGYDLLDYATSNKENAIDMPLNPSPKRIDAVLSTGIGQLARTFAILNTVLDLKQNERLEKLAAITEQVKSISKELQK